MQNKLNEILELCIEKSKGRIFYTFEYCAGAKMLWINKYYTSEFEDKNIFKFFDTNVDQALEYMQNE